MVRARDRERISGLTSLMREAAAAAAAAASSGRREMLLGSAGMVGGGAASGVDDVELEEGEVWAVNAVALPPPPPPSVLFLGRSWRSVAESNREPVGLSSLSRLDAAARATSTASRMIPPSIVSSPSSNGGVSASSMQHVAMSAPVNVPHWSKTGQRRRPGVAVNDEGADPTGAADEAEDEVDEGGARLPPHLMVARSQVSTFSVFEGAGRTLKGRDLSRVRNAVLKQTGFL